MNNSYWFNLKRWKEKATLQQDPLEYAVSNLEQSPFYPIYPQHTYPFVLHDLLLELSWKYAILNNKKAKKCLCKLSEVSLLKGVTVNDMVDIFNKYYFLNKCKRPVKHSPLYYKKAGTHKDIAPYREACDSARRVKGVITMNAVMDKIGKSIIEKEVKEAMIKGLPLLDCYKSNRMYQIPSDNMHHLKFKTDFICSVVKNIKYEKILLHLKTKYSKINYHTVFHYAGVFYPFLKKVVPDIEKIPADIANHKKSNHYKTYRKELEKQINTNSPYSNFIENVKTFIGDNDISKEDLQWLIAKYV